MGLATIENQYLGGGARLDCSDVTAADVDTEVMNILKGCYEEAKKLLSENRELMDKLAAHLIEKETITGKEFMKIYRKEKGIPEPEEDEEKGLEEKKGIEKKEEEKKPEKAEAKAEEEKKEEAFGAGDMPGGENSNLWKEEDEMNRTAGQGGGPVGRFSNTSGNFEP